MTDPFSSAGAKTPPKPFTVTDGVRKVVNVLEIIPEEETRRIDNALLGARTPPPMAAPVENR